MAYTLQQLSDFEDIRTLKHRYFRGIDTADIALLSSLFTEDVAVDYRGGTYRVTLTGSRGGHLVSGGHRDHARDPVAHGRLGALPG